MFSGYFFLQKGYLCAETLQMSEQIYDIIDKQPSWAGEIIIDDRLDLSIGYRLREARLHGYPKGLCVTKQVQCLPDSF